MRVALVCDWLTTIGGAEKVLLELHHMYPKAPIYTSQYSRKGIDWFDDADVRTGWLQIFPKCLRRFLAPLRVIYFKHLDLSSYDLIISVTGAEAKGVRKGTARHLCYCHVPTQYYWQMYNDYVKNPGFGILDPIVRFFFKLFVGPLRRADYAAAQLPDQFITISTYAAEQIRKYYKREAVIVAPPVAVENFSTRELTSLPKRSGFIITSRQVTWKRLDLAVKACLQTGHQLTLIGDGPEHQHLVKLANGSPLIKFIPTSNAKTLRRYLAKSEAFLFPSLEPFGIAPVEALAAGCPVIAYHEGGSRDFIKDGKNGIFFERQAVPSLVSAIKKFEQTKFNSDTVSASATSFSALRFVEQIKRIVENG